jgi:hypothetical protein
MFSQSHTILSNLALPPFQLPARMLEVIRTEVALDHRSEVDIQDAGVATAVGAL